jgi:hypothetical protein
MSTVTSEVMVVMDGKIVIQDTIALPPDQHYELELRLHKVKCNCPKKQHKETAMILSTEEDLDTQPAGAVAADKEHDDWVKTPSGEWTYKNGPLMRAKTLMALWGPFTLVRVPEVSLAA